MKKFQIFGQIVIGILCVSLLGGCFYSNAKPCQPQEKVTKLSKRSAEETKAPAPKRDLSMSDEELNAFSNQLYGWGLVKKKGSAPEVDATQADLLGRHHGYYCDKKHVGQKVLYLTFDEGYENGYTDKILDVLKEKKVPAAFFVTGPYLETQQDLVKRMVKEGHVVGNHTVHHPSMPDMQDNAALAQELVNLNDMFYDLTHQNMQFVRPPRGEFSERTLALTENLGYQTVLWSFAYRDWETDRFIGADGACGAIIPYFHDGAILLLHAVSKDNADALSRVIDEAQNQGYRFVSLNNLLT